MRLTPIVYKFHVSPPWTPGQGGLMIPFSHREEGHITEKQATVASNLMTATSTGETKENKQIITIQRDEANNLEKQFGGDPTQSAPGKTFLRE